MRKFASAFALVPIAFVSVVACSSSSSGGNSTPCNQEGAKQCPTGQTCWAEDANTFACLNSGSGKLGDSCTSVFGTPACGDNLACLQTSQTSQGVCVQLCDPTNSSRTCPADSTCSKGSFGGMAVFYVCAPNSPPNDGGTDSGGGDSGGGDTGGGQDGSSGDGGDEAAPPDGGAD